MAPFFILPKLFLAGGALLGAFQTSQLDPLDNHTLLGDKIPSTQVVTRSMWGTPMLPDGKAGYSLVAPIKKELIDQSLWIPPVSGKRPPKKSPAGAAPSSPAALTDTNAPASPAALTDTNAPTLPAAGN